MIEVRRVRPDDSFSVYQIPGGVPPFDAAARWVVTIHGEVVGRPKHFFGFTQKQALRKADRYLRAIDKAEKSRRVIDA